MKYRMGWPDGSGKEDTILRGEEPVLVPWRTKGCSCCASEATVEDTELLKRVVELLNADEQRARRRRGG